MRPRQDSSPSTPETLGPFAPVVECLVAAIVARLPSPDELIPVAAAPLAALGLEHAAVSRLVADGRLRAVRIGRRLFTKRSYLLALVDELPHTRRVREDAPERDLLSEAVAKMARRASARKREKAAKRASANAV